MKSVVLDRSVWVSWESHRRTQELARVLGVEQHTFEYIGRPVLRYLRLSWLTVALLFRKRPKIVFVQNPSIALATLACLLKNLLNYKLVVDRHSNFRFATLSDRSIKWRVFHWASKYTVRSADVTIVTNEYLRSVVELWGGRGFVLQDKMPEMKSERLVDLTGDVNIVFVSTFSDDEPVKEVIGAAARIDCAWNIYVTGNKNRFFEKYGSGFELPGNVFLTGFLPEELYQGLLASADLVIVLTKNDHTLTCGAYEGVALNKPMVLSDTSAIREYFSKGAVYAKPDEESIAKAIIEAVNSRQALKVEVDGLMRELSGDWDKRRAELLRLVAADGVPVSNAAQ